MLTKRAAIRKHRRMWKWIARQTRKRKCRVDKPHYFRKHPNLCRPDRLCYCCEYDRRCFGNQCQNCPLDWGKQEEFACDRGGLFERWRCATDYKESAMLADRIARLPKR